MCKTDTLIGFRYFRLYWHIYIMWVLYAVLTILLAYQCAVYAHSYVYITSSTHIVSYSIKSQSSELVHSFTTHRKHIPPYLHRDDVVGQKVLSVIKAQRFLSSIWNATTINHELELRPSVCPETVIEQRLSFVIHRIDGWKDGVYVNARGPSPSLILFSIGYLLPLHFPSYPIPKHLIKPASQPASHLSRSFYRIMPLPSPPKIKNQGGLDVESSWLTDLLIYWLTDWLLCILSISIDLSPSLFISVYLCPSLFLFIYIYLFLFIFIFIYLSLSLSISIHFYLRINRFISNH